jgi:hypothetical protein
LMMLNFNMKRDGKCSKKFCIYLWENIWILIEILI